VSSLASLLLDEMFTWDESFDEEALFNLSNLQALSSQDSFSYGVGVIFYCKTS